MNVLANTGIKLLIVLVPPCTIAAFYFWKIVKKLQKAKVEKQLLCDKKAKKSPRRHFRQGPAIRLH